ncbi:SDR family oxidoreductase [Pimelobacter simplex]|uniref:3-oxoacyl-[acyl-carrier protein] reductase n=1 Tax=Nocardioides simplex TaxID=2045 RepID=A0A0A1DPT8_NOCSI|nr:SDR family NAD(P)-dependent oxidoreductase [Pimelobacter simplex]AIY18533.1 3-oxoacyl-[acyl-carrier protein] reductase [Pimelobacter simplex]MCG8153306.1 SDR family oxidoreductase [Pimelobacter simplex]GEB14160.1 short-chain dehydrogenase [Pimelobacter simplex]SFM32944.1 NAD(P)-dependent dehydrogenase, short-chain alcohol dehydrogenase family [Pimelobacter simplex]
MKVTVVIGGASGIGAATARLLAASGHQVVVADLPGTSADAHVDVTDEVSVAALLDGVVAEHGALHGVVNCAGVSTLARVVDHDAAEWRRVVDVCLTGAFLVLKHAGQRVADGGALVSLSSLNARQPGTGLAAYCAAKAGLVALTEVTALELGARGVRVNAVAPGLVVTPLTAPAMDIPGVRDDYVDNTALGRSGEPDEIAAAIRFLLSDDAAWITGETLDINGGAHLRRYPDLVGLVEKAFG